LSEYGVRAKSNYLNTLFLIILMALGNLIERIKRVLLVSTKPDREEFKQSVKITGMGILIIGTVGFVIFILIQLIGGL
jgi:protein transport protein SEC61 subunit gamma-like protein